MTARNSLLPSFAEATLRHDARCCATGEELIERPGNYPLVLLPRRTMSRTTDVFWHDSRLVATIATSARIAVMTAGNAEKVLICKDFHTAEVTGSSPVSPTKRPVSCRPPLITFEFLGDLLFGSER
jgi:hypothetical protein